MADCIYCGKPAGMFEVQHVDCANARQASPPPPPISSAIDIDEIVRRLGPAIKMAGFQAGVAAALTFFFLGVVAVLIRFLFSLA